MKNILRNSNFGFTKWCVALIAAGWMGAASSEAAVLLEENFTFTGALTLNGWTAANAGGTSVINASTPSLSYSGLASSGIGGAASLTTSGEDDRKTFTSQSGDVYASCLINLSAAQATGDYFFMLSSGTTGFISRVFAKSSGSGFVLGLSKSTSTATYGSTVLNFNTTYLVVIKIAKNAVTTSDDVSSLWVNPVLGGLETTPLLTSTTTSDQATVDSVIVRQGTAANAPTLKVDSILVATTWAEVTPAGGASSPTVTTSLSTLSAFSTTAGTASAAQTFTVTGSNLMTDVTVTAPTGFEVSNDGTNYASSQTLTQSGGAVASTTISVRIAAATAQGSPSGNVTLASTGATTANVAVSGTVNAAGVAAVAVTGGTLTAFSTVAGTASAAQSFTVSGQNLTSDITVTAPTGFEVSTDAQSYAFSKTVTQVSGTVASTTISVRIAAGTAAGTLASANVAVAATGVTTANVAVSGTVTTPALTLTLNPTSVAENAGANASTGTVGIPTVLSSNLVVSLVSSNTAAATVPSTVTITNGKTSATFPIDAVANTNSYANATAVITASVTNYTSASATLTVSNVDVAPVTTISLVNFTADSSTQNFDALGTASITSAISSTAGVQTSLAAVTGSSTLNGWYATKLGGTGTTATAITADAGAGTGGFLYNYGVASASDRALGMLASGSNWMALGALIKNDTGATINSIKLSFTAEFWRSSTSVQNVLSCAIGKLDDSTITTANFLTAPSAIALVRGNITGPAAVATSAALDGNLVANQVAFTDVVIPLQLAPGETGFVRWSDVNDGGNDAGLAIDNLRMTASLDLPAADGDGAVSLANSTVSSPYTLSGIWAAGGTAQGVSVNVTPLLDSTTLTSASILVPTEFGVPLVGNVTATGGATGGTPTVVGQLITLNGVSITKANPGVINIAGLSTPPTGTIAAGNGVYPFTVSTAGDGGTLKAVFASPAANVLIPIANIRDIDANGAPVDKNTIVAVEGICTAAPLGGTSFIQDASYGIAIYPSTTTPAFTLGMVAGRKYAVVGTLVDYNGMAEIKPASVSGVVDLGVASIPTPTTITVVEAKAEQYESMLVTIAGLTKDAAETDPWAATKVITVKNSAGDVIDVRIQSESTATTEPAYPVTITGILQQNSSATPRALTYQIMPRTAEDLSFAPGLRLTFAEAYLFESTNPPLGGAIVSGALTVSRTGADTSAALVVALSASPTGLLQFPASVTIPAGQESVSVTVEAIDNAGFNAAGFTNVTLTASALGSGLGDGSTTVMILEDEASAPADTIKPVITLIGANPQLVANGGVYTDLKATVTDNVDASREITGTGTVNTAVAGDYTITYNASDAAGNAAIAVTRIVRVAAPLGTTYSGWLGQASASDVAFLDYVFGAATPGTLDPSLRPTVAVTGGNLVLTYNVRQGTTGLTVTPKTSSDLASGLSGWVTTDVTVADVGAARSVNGVSVQQKTASVPVSGAKRFLRVEAVQQQ